MKTLRRVFTAALGCGLTATFALTLLVSWVPTQASAAPLVTQDKGRGDKAGSDKGSNGGKESSKSDACGHDGNGGKNDTKGGGSGQHGDPPSCSTDRGGRRP